MTENVAHFGCTIQVPKKPFNAILHSNENSCKAITYNVLKWVGVQVRGGKR